MVRVELSDAAGDLEQIIALQRLNHAHMVAAESLSTEGFVTMAYTVPELQRMCGRYRHVVAKSEGQVVGYALVMLKESRQDFPFLDGVFAEAEAIAAGRTWFVMGQVCIDHSFRGQGIFRRLYHGLREQMRADFDMVVTEVSTRNARSMGAHLGVGFRDLTKAGPVSEWRVIGWDWN